MDITMIGLQNAGKTSLLRVLAVSAFPRREMIVLRRPTPATPIRIH
jgi:GTPase SAR1 family protein